MEPFLSTGVLLLVD